MPSSRWCADLADASTAVLTKYERPADQGEAVQVKRAGYGQSYFAKYAPVVYPEKLTEGYYRVRKDWDDKKSQIGAYRVLANAKKAADENPGNFVFTDEGVSIYPVTAEPQTPAEDEFRIHTVVKGDTLWDIAVKYLGKGSRYTEIKKLNGLKSNVIYSGWKLKIPN
jgi:LysM repeat protein